MNLQEFSALKVGDRVANGMNPDSAGEVVETTNSGVRVVWGQRHSRETPFFYSVQSTNWMHWNKSEPAPGRAPLTAEQADDLSKRAT